MSANRLPDYINKPWRVPPFLQPFGYCLETHPSTVSTFLRGAGVKATLIVAGTLLSEGRRKKHGIVANRLCGSVMQGILLVSNNISVSADVLASGIACRDTGRDEKDYWHFAHAKVLKFRSIHELGVWFK